MDEADGDPVRRDPSSAAKPNARAVAVADVVMEWQRHNGAAFDIAAGELERAPGAGVVVGSFARNMTAH